MEFIPLEVLQFPVYRGMLVSKIIQTIDPSTNTPHGPNMKLLQAGSIVQVTLQVTTPDALSSVMLVDLLPGGLEAIDPLLDGDSSLGEGYGTHTPRGRGGYYYYYSRTFGAQETRPDRVQFVATHLGAGVHTVTYKAVAATKGAFVLPPAKAFSTEQPELMGLSAGGGLIVQEGVVDLATYEVALESVVLNLQEEHGNLAVATTELLPKTAMEDRFGPVVSSRRVLQDCEGGCPNGGICNVEKGMCECYRDFRLVDGDCEGLKAGTGIPVEEPINDEDDDNEDATGGSVIIIALVIVGALVCLGVTSVVVWKQSGRSNKVINP